MDGFRYPHTCPLARATEVIGHRWVLLILRELWAGPQRFADLKRRLSGISTSVLSERLVLLEEEAIIERRRLPPPGAARVYVLTPDGKALRPALVELTRWGLRRLLPPRPGDHIEPDWVALAIDAFRLESACQPLRYELRILVSERTTVVRLEGGAGGIRRVDDDGAPVDVVIEAEAVAMLAVLSGLLPPEQHEASGVRTQGDTAALAALPSHFHFDFGDFGDPSDPGVPNPPMKAGDPQ